MVQAIAKKAQAPEEEEKTMAQRYAERNAAKPKAAATAVKSKQAAKKGIAWSMSGEAPKPKTPAFPYEFTTKQERLGAI